MWHRLFTPISTFSSRRFCPTTISTASESIGIIWNIKLAGRASQCGIETSNREYVSNFYVVFILSFPNLILLILKAKFESLRYASVLHVSGARWKHNGIFSFEQQRNGHKCAAYASHHVHYDWWYH